MQKESNQSLRVLRILLSVSEVSGPYNQFTIPFADTQDITLHLLNEPKLKIKKGISYQSCKGKYFDFFIKAIKQSIKSYDLIHLHHSNLAPLAFLIRLINRKKDTKIIFTLGTCFTNLKPRHKFFLYFSRHYFDHFICCSQSVYDSLPKWFMSQNISMIRHGINMDRILAKPNHMSQIIVATRLIKQKNIDLIINAFAQIKDFSTYNLIIAGDGPSREELELLAKNLNLDKMIHFLGSRSRNEVLELMSESKFYLSASESDGMPIAVLEAVSSGCVPILLNSTPHLEVLKENIFGLLFENNKNSLSQTLIESLRITDRDLEQHSVKNIKQAKSEFSVDQMMKKYLDLISE